MTPPAGTLHLVPNTLDFGLHAEPAPLDDLLPMGVIRIAARLEHWVAENAKTTRAFLKRVDAVCPLARPLQSISIVELQRPPKGRASTCIDATALEASASLLLAPALAGSDLGLISEAGLAALADPGAQLVAAAHAAGLRVTTLPGASAIALAVSASGLNGQSFAFVGYLPVEAQARTARIRELEELSKRHVQTQLVIETPYRNQALLEALVAQLRPQTSLAVCIGLTTRAESTISRTVAAWRHAPLELPADVPAVFSFLAR